MLRLLATAALVCTLALLVAWADDDDHPARPDASSCAAVAATLASCQAELAQVATAPPLTVTEPCGDCVACPTCPTVAFLCQHTKRGDRCSPHRFLRFQ